MKKYFFTLTIFLCADVYTSQSQSKLVPLTFGKPNPANIHLNSRFAGQSDTVSLPFYDDFSSSYFQDSLWLSGSPVNINNRFSANQPTKGMATFDGLNSKGEPYDFSSTSTWGRADSLMSLAITLNYSNSDSVYLSFFYEAGGLGDKPDINDSLCLYFLDTASAWKLVWSQRGTDTPAFKNVFIFIGNPYLFNGFRFKFISYGNLFGQHDIWNLDNVYLNKNRSVSEKPIGDISFNSKITPLLKRYYSVPYNHLLKHADSAVNNEIKFLISNYYQRDTSVNLRYVLLNNDSGDTLLSVTLNPLSLDSSAANISSTILIDTSGLALPDSLNELFLTSILYIKNTGTFPNNDTISTLTQLSRFYAYDDNSAEWAYGLKENYGAFAVKFVTYEPDTLSQIAINFPQIWKDVSNRNIEITVWQKINESDTTGVKDSVVYSRVEKPGTLKTLDSLTLFNLDSILIISDTFYVGFVVPSDEFIFVGLDRNTDTSKQTFIFLGNKWKNIEVPGTLLIRPVFDKFVSTGIKEQSIVKAVSPCYPNPNSGILYCSGFSEDFQLLDIYGRIILTLTNNKELTLPEELPKGIYFLYRKSEKGIFYQKIVLQ